MSKKPTKPSTLRLLTAYATTAKILLSYFQLAFLKRLLGATRLETRTLQTHRKNARRLKKNVLKLKGLFIKVGQMVSIMTNFLPETFTQELEGLQDAVPPSPLKDIEKRFFEEFGKSPTEIFDRFEPDPIASASLGQVHIAYLKDGTKLAVKVQYPDIETTVKSDLVTLKRIFSLLHLIFPQYGLKKIYEEVREVVLEELDFEIEGRNLEKIRNNFEEETDFLFPEVFWQYSKGRVLTLGFMEGVKISNVEKIKSLGADPTDVAKKLLHAYCKQIFIDGLYHADPHPGNFLVQASLDKESGNISPKIVFMDFGALASISESMRHGIGKFIEGIIRRDNRIISQSLKDMGFISKMENDEVFDRIVEYFYDRIKNIKMDDLRNIKINIADLNRIDDLFEFRKLDIPLKDLLQTFNVPKDWALLERALIVLVGLTTHLDPKLNPFEIIIPYAEEFVLGEDRNFKDLVTEAIKEVVLSYLKLPATLEKTLKQLSRGELTVKIPPDKKGNRQLTRSINRLTYSLLILGGLYTSHLMNSQGMEYARMPLYISGAFAFLFLINFLRRN